MTAQDCLARASQCLREAGQTDDNSAFVVWIELATGWIDLAKQPDCERSEEAAQLETREADLQRTVVS